jgi:acyl carrier protein
MRHDLAEVPGGVLPRLAEVVSLVTGLPAAEVRPERLLVDDLRIDSLAMVEILEGAAQRFGVPVEDEAVKQIVRVGDLVDYLEWQLARR